MTARKMAIPITESFCVDLIRFSDGRLTPERIGELAEEAFFNFLERTSDNHFNGLFGERAFEFANVYFPEVAAAWLKDDLDSHARHRKETQPLVWKEITVPHGSEVRMSYDKMYHYAKVKNGQIVDDSGSYSPSEWVSKVARGTSRNAWRDLWFKEPNARHWVPAELLRDQARSEIIPLSLEDLV